MKHAPSWLADAVFYQVYPPSFYDSNDDGTGDIPGIIAKLDYIQWLGCNAIWLNPCFVSPFRDGGYDISDYYKVAPRYGTNRDLIHLFQAARQRGIRVLLDLVPGHTSIEHRWFKESSKASPNGYGDWYIWNHGVLEDFTSNLVRGQSERDASYQANFFWFQPALNYGYAKPEEPWQQPVDAPGPRAVRAELKNIMRFWLDKGAGGFRVDMAFALIKNDKNYRATRELWREIRSMLDEEYPDAAIISEWGDPAAAIRSGFHADLLLPQGADPTYRALFGDRLRFDASQAEYFGVLDGGGSTKLEAAMHSYLRLLSQTGNRGFLCPNTASHDIARLVDGRTLAQVKLIYLWLLTSRGVPFIYYGDEIGMRYQPLNSKEGGYKRTGSRTPMQWDDRRNCGFSKASKKELYLPIDEKKGRPTVVEQSKSEHSLLNFVRRLIELRREHPALAAASKMEMLYCRNKKGLAFLRQKGIDRIIVALNPYSYPTRMTVSTDKPILNAETILASGCAVDPRQRRLGLQMPAHSYAVVKIC